MMKPNLRNILVGVLTLVLLTGCSNDNARICVAEVSGFETSVTVYPEVVHSYDIIPLEQTDGCILTGIRKIAKVDSSYIVFDNYNNLIVRYGTDGKFLNRIGCKGRAASEYLRIDTFVMDKDGRVMILDGSQDKILIYEPGGKYVSSVTFPKRTLGFVNAAACLDDSDILVNNCVYNNSNDIYSILSLSDKTATVIAGFSMVSDNIVEPTGKTTIGGYGRILFLKPFDDTLYTVDGKNNVEPILYVAHTKKTVDDKYFNAHPTFSSATTYMGLSQDGYFTGFVSVFETEHYLLICTYNDIYFLVDKSTNSGRPLRLATCDDYIGVPLLNIVASSSDDFIGYWRPGDFSDENSLDQIGNPSNESVHSFVTSLRSLPEDGNPCLIVYHLNK